MKRAKISDMVGGWFVGNFTPSIYFSSEFEACVKWYKKGETELSHYQKKAIEITVIISGIARMGDVIIEPGDIILLEPGEVCDFEALEDIILVAVKSPSLPSDKVAI